MDILTDIQETLSPLEIPMETGLFADEAPDTYLVAVPLSDTFGLHADNAPGADIREVRISLFSRGNYIADRNRVVNALLAADFTVTERRYVGFETDTGYHHYAIDAAKLYDLEE